VYLRSETGTKAHSNRNIKKLPHILNGRHGERAQEQPTTQQCEFEQKREKGWDGDCAKTERRWPQEIRKGQGEK
jgi:hypothetical protein